jgi:hypothetical protein
MRDFRNIIWVILIFINSIIGFNSLFDGKYFSAFVSLIVLSFCCWGFIKNLIRNETSR